jgi:FkbM family methyltransferase
MWFAQHGEDRKLNELLKDKQAVFWVDVGAWEPVVDSVTKFFYERGGTGINIEPLPEYFKMLVEDRIGDVNLECAVSDTGGGALHELYRLAAPNCGATPQTGLSTFDTRNAVDGMTRTGFEMTKIKVPVYTLAEICAEHVPPGQHIDFLKIDVEGWEEQVIRGMDWERWRPQILCIEATRPSSNIPAWDWEPLVLAAGYRFLEFDGLNRFYRDAR